MKSVFSRLKDFLTTYSTSIKSYRKFVPAIPQLLPYDSCVYNLLILYSLPIYKDWMRISVHGSTNRELKARDNSRPVEEGCCLSQMLEKILNEASDDKYLRHWGNIVYTQLCNVHKISHECSITINVAIQLHARFNNCPNLVHCNNFSTSFLMLNLLVSKRPFANKRLLIIQSKPRSNTKSYLDVLWLSRQCIQ